MANKKDNKEARRYYDFSSLLSPKVMNPIERLGLVKKMHSIDNSMLKEIMANSIMNTFVIIGDNVYDDDRRIGHTVAKEGDIEDVISVLRSAPDLASLAKHINKKLLCLPADEGNKARKIYSQLFDFGLTKGIEVVEHLTCGKTKL